MFLYVLEAAAIISAFFNALSGDFTIAWLLVAVWGICFIPKRPTLKTRLFFQLYISETFLFGLIVGLTIKNFLKLGG